MIRVAICDDEAWYREELRKYCEKYFEEAHLEYQLKEYASGEETQGELIRSKGQGGCLTDILILDIEMKAVDGIQLKDAMQEERSEIRILFVTSHEEVITEAFGSHVFGFLKKPVKYQLFQKKMNRIVEDIKHYEKFVIVENASGIKKVYLNQVQYIQAYGKFSQMFLEKESLPVFSEHSISSWRKELEIEGFSLCHKSYLVNFYHIKSIKEDILLKDGTRVPMSRRMQKACKEQYKEYLWYKARQE